ncbi:RraA family protein [Altericroceibacterium endophyticum]|uniref:Putative 4-hydroxy-4-methyl-2-oxoglutarate aldolase n=1 Tax=Altericroceibacterium endophyticum TaxID=1808508 RepID=A0A6I4T6K6_9SPHN|nr:RraA family protein [Altericroceibacterium endophyticum]MXO66844.1 RraA family protein [Altericroceibacterium endophyticum]
MDDDLIAQLRALDACALSDALDKLGLSGCVSGLVASTPGVKIAGRVHTVKLAPGSPPEGSKPRHLGAAAIDASDAGEIIVMEQRTGIEAGSWGGILSRAAQYHGISGVIAEGLVRDIDEAREIGFPVFSRGFTARTARARVHEAATDVPVRVGDITVSPGDYAFADSSAVIFLPADQAAEVVETARMVAAREAEMTRRLAQGESASDVLGANYEYMLEARGDE